MLVGVFPEKEEILIIAVSIGEENGSFSSVVIEYIFKKLLKLTGLFYRYYYSQFFMKPFIKGHIVRVLTQFQQEIDKRPFGAYRLPAFEFFLKKYLQANKDLSTASDNSFIIANCFKLLRFKTFIDYRFQCKDWSERLENMNYVEELTPDSIASLDIPL